MFVLAIKESAFKKKSYKTKIDAIKNECLK